MNHYRCTLIDSDTMGVLDLGIFAGRDSEQARDKCEKRYANLVRKLATGKWSLTVEQTEDPLAVENRKRRLRLRDATPDMFPVEKKA